MEILFDNKHIYDQHALIILEKGSKDWNWNLDLKHNIMYVITQIKT